MGRWNGTTADVRSRRRRGSSRLRLLTIINSSAQQRLTQADWMYSMVKIAKAAEPKGNIPWLSLLANFFRLFVMTELLRWSWESMCWRRDKLWLWTRALTMGFYFSILSSLAMLETKLRMCRSLRWSSPISWSHTQKLTKTLSSLGGLSSHCGLRQSIGAITIARLSSQVKKKKWKSYFHFTRRAVRF